MKLAWLVSAILCMAPSATFAAEPSTGSPPTEAEIQKLIAGLDDEDFKVREAATAALIALGDVAESAVIAASQKLPGSELQKRASQIVRAIGLARVIKNATKLDSVYLPARDICEEKADAKELEPTIDKLLADLNSATPRSKQGAPVKISACRRRAAASFEDSEILYLNVKQMVHLERSTALVDLAAQIHSANDSIIVAWGMLDVSFAKNSVIIAGGDVNVQNATNCTILCGGRLTINQGGGCRLGGGDGVEHGIHQEKSYVINSGKNAAPTNASEPAYIEIPGLVLRGKRIMEPLLEGKLKPTLVQEDYLLFKLPGETGERVVRKGDELLDLTGKAIVGLEGWRLVMCARTFAAFKNGSRQTFVRMPFRR